MTAVLLGLRFLVELCLFAAMAVVGWGAVANHLVGAVAGVVLALVVATVWGVLLSPKRRIDLPLFVRVVVELVLFATAAVGLAAQGHPSWGIALMVAEVAVLVALALRGFPPGRDAAAVFPAVD
jgi:hypothetical protein